jgi:hypothetical protein
MAADLKSYENGPKFGAQILGGSERVSTLKNSHAICWNCGVEIGDKQKFCGTDCADIWCKDQILRREIHGHEAELKSEVDKAIEYRATLSAIGDIIGEEGVSALDSQHGGDHYAKLGKYQPYCVLQKWMTPEELKGFAKGSAIAYLAREQDKGGREDIKKAVHHLQLYLELTKGEE